MRLYCGQKQIVKIAVLALLCLHAALGEKDEAFKWLSYEPHHIWTPWLFSKEWQVFTKPLHGDPRFREMQRKMNVPALEM